MNNKFAILASGKLGFECILKISSTYTIDFIFTDKNSVDIIEFAKLSGLPIFIGNPRNNNTAEFLKNRIVDYILSINYLYIIENDVIRFPVKYAINFHGSLLPKYRGRTPHIWSIINNEKITGITAHILTEDCDKGDIILQEPIEIFDFYTGNDLLDVYNKLYPIFIERVIKLIETDDFVLKKQDEILATWYNKRTPEDGQISWNWQKERMFNWVRALSNPYPGAFSFYKNEKIIIDSIEYSSFGYKQDDKDGLILEGGHQPIIKTTNGSIKILKTRNKINCIKGNYLYERH
jgi:methionyl-tRNA formyltransferase